MTEPRRRKQDVESLRPPIEKILELREEGISCRDIGRRYGFTEKTIQTWIRKKVKGILMMREKFWRWLLEDYPEGCYLPKWAIVLRCILFPVKSFFWLVDSHNPYDFITDTWNILGVKYSGNMLFMLSKANGETYRIYRHKDRVTMEKL